MQIISIKELHPHPNNTAPYSVKYKCRVYPERVEQLARLIELNGFDANYPIVARMMVGYGKPYYEVIEGNHRLMAVKDLYKLTGLPKWQSVPVEVKDMDDREVAIAQVTRQGRPIDTLIHAVHLYNLLGDFGGDRSDYLAKTSEYAVLCGLSVRTVRGLYRIGEVVEHLKVTMNPKHFDLLKDRISPYIFEEMAQLPKYQWCWFALYFLRNKVSFGDARTMILRAKFATTDIVYDPDQEHYINKILTEIAEYKDSNLEVLKAWCERQLSNAKTDDTLPNITISNQSNTETGNALAENGNYGYLPIEISINSISGISRKDVCIVENCSIWHFRGEICPIMIINPLVADGVYQSVRLYGDRPDIVVKEYIITAKKITSPANAKLVTIIYDKPIKLEQVQPVNLSGIQGREVGGLLLALMRSLNSAAYYLVKDQAK